MEPIKISLDGKIYTVDWTKHTAEQLKELGQLIERMNKNRTDIDAAYKTLTFITGIPEEKLNELDGREIMTLFAFIKEKIDKIIRMQSH